MAKYDDRQRLINKINARLKAYGLTEKDLKVIQKNVSSIDGVYPTKKGISIDETKWKMKSAEIKGSLEDKIKTFKERRKEARDEIAAVKGKKAATPEAISSKMAGNLYKESIFDDVHDAYYDIMPNKEQVNAAKLKADPLKSKLFDDMKAFGSLVSLRNDDSKALELKASILEQIVAIKERDKNAKEKK